MPHHYSRGAQHYWAPFEPQWTLGGTTATTTTTTRGKGGGPAKVAYINRDNHKTPIRRSSIQQQHVRARSLPIISEQDENAPPVTDKSAQKHVNISIKPVSKSGKVMGLRPLSIAPPSLLSWLPCMPTPTYNSRHELQRRVSPTALTFGSPFTSSPPLSPLSPVTPASATFSTNRNPYKSTPTITATPMDEEPVYVLTLRTSDDIAQTMQTLRKRWFPADRLKVPAHITLFHALPESRLAEVEDHINEMKRFTPRFEVSTGRVMRMRQGVLVNLDEGDWDVRQLYGRMRSAFYDWLSEQDKSCKAHYTIQNKEQDQERVDDAFQDTFRAGPVLGWATGLVLWKYNDGHWLKEKEFDFEGNSRHRSLSPHSATSSRRVSR